MFDDRCWRAHVTCYTYILPTTQRNLLLCFDLSVIATICWFCLIFFLALFTSELKTSTHQECHANRIEGEVSEKTLLIVHAHAWKTTCNARTSWDAAGTRLRLALIRKTNAWDGERTRIN